MYESNSPSFDLALKTAYETILSTGKFSCTEQDANIIHTGVKIMWQTDKNMRKFRYWNTEINQEHDVLLILHCEPDQLKLPKNKQLFKMSFSTDVEMEITPEDKAYCMYVNSLPKPNANMSLFPKKSPN